MVNFPHLTTRGLGLNPAPGRFGIFTAVVFMMHYLGEVLAVIFMGIFRQEAVVNSVTALVLAIAGLISSGFVRYVPAAIAFESGYSEPFLLWGLPRK